MAKAQGMDVQLPCWGWVASNELPEVCRSLGSSCDEGSAFYQTQLHRSVCLRKGN